MKKVSFDKASREYTHIMALSITVLVFLMLMSNVGAAPFAYVPNSGSNNVSNLIKHLKMT